MRQCEKNDVRQFSDFLRIRINESQILRLWLMAESWKHFTQCSSDRLPGCDCYQIGERVFQEEPDELLARIPGSADHRDLRWHFSRHNAQCVLQPDSIAMKSRSVFDARPKTLSRGQLRAFAISLFHSFPPR